MVDPEKSTVQMDSDPNYTLKAKDCTQWPSQSPDLD